MYITSAYKALENIKKLTFLFDAGVGVEMKLFELFPFPSPSGSYMQRVQCDTLYLTVEATRIQRQSLAMENGPKGVMFG